MTDWYIRTLDDSSQRTLSDGRVRTIWDPEWFWTLEAYLGGAWESIGQDVLIRNHDMSAARGIDGAGPASRVAGVGTLTFTLDNSEANSAGLLGYYSPDHTNLRSGFGRGTPVRLSLTSNSVRRYIWNGKINTIEPSAGQFGERAVFVQCVDYMATLMMHKLNGIPVQEDKRPDQVIDTILANVTEQPTVTSTDTDTITLTRALHSDQDERSTAMSAMQKVAMSALGYVFMRGGTSGDVFKYQMRHSRNTDGTPATLNNTMSELSVTRSGQLYYTRVTGVVHPIEVDSGASTLLASLASEITLAAGQTMNIIMRYRDPSGAGTRISGTNVVTTLVADTHYKMSSVSGNGGNDLNANLDVSVSDGGNVAFVELENTGGTTGYVNKLEIKGDGIYLYDPYEIYAGDEDGEALTFDFYYLDDANIGEDFVAAVYNKVNSDATIVKSVSFYGDSSSTLLGYAKNRDIGGLVSLTETATGISSLFYIQKIEYTFQTDGRLLVTWALDPAIEESFFTLDDADLGVLNDEDVVLAY